MITTRDVYGSALSAVFTAAMFLGPLAAAVGMLPTPEPVVDDYEPPVITMTMEQLSLLADLADQVEIAADTAPEPEPVREAAVEPPAPPALPDAPVKPVPAPKAEPEVEPKAEPGAEPAPAEAEARPKVAVSREQRLKERCGESFPGVLSVAADTFHVDREVLDYYSASVARLNTLGYSHRYEEGEVKGWVVGGFGCKSPLWHGGLRARDVVQTVNGKKTHNVLQIVGIWLSQRHKSSFEVTVLRKGKLVTLHYKVV